MDSSSLSKQKSAKRLSELLQEQQEPFRLDVYLMERGYIKKILNSNNVCTGYSSKDMKKSGSYGLKMMKRTPVGRKILKTVLNKLVSNKDARETSTSCDGIATENRNVNVSMKAGRSAHHFTEPDRFSSASSMTVYESSSESDTTENGALSPQQNQPCTSCILRNQVIVADRKQQRGCIEENKQHIPVSVQEELPSDEASPFRNHMRCCSRSIRSETPSTSTFNQPKIVTEASILSAFLMDLLAHSSLEKHGTVGSKELSKLLDTCASFSSQYRKTKRVLEQRKQLLFDCVREILETNEKSGQIKRLFGAEQIGKIICEQLCFWAKQSGNITNISKLIGSDFLESIEEWNDFNLQTRKVGIEIGNAILEDMESEIVSDIFHSFS